MATGKYISIEEYQQLWDTMTIDKTKLQYVINDAKKILRYRERFQALSEITGNKIPWYFLGIVYFREEGCNFRGHMHNGDTLKHKTTNVPMNRPLHTPADPAGYTFEESALDLIKFKEWDKVRAWIMPIMLYHLEANNGFGYRSKDIHSPYLWNCTNHYEKGYYVADHKFDYDTVCKSTGAAPLMRYLTDKTLGLV